MKRNLVFLTLCLLALCMTSCKNDSNEGNPIISDCTVIGKLYYDSSGWIINIADEGTLIDGEYLYEVKDYPINLNKDSTYHVEAIGECHQ